MFYNSSEIFLRFFSPRGALHYSLHPATCRDAFGCKHISSQIKRPAKNTSERKNKVHCAHSISFIWRLHNASFRAILPSRGFCKWKAERDRSQEHCWISIPFISAAMPIQSTKRLVVYAIFVCIVNSPLHTFTGLPPPMLCLLSLCTSTVKHWAYC